MGNRAAEARSTSALCLLPAAVFLGGGTFPWSPVLLAASGSGDGLLLEFTACSGTGRGPGRRSNGFARFPTVAAALEELDNMDTHV